ncbi:cytochrome ubiquinol oxidase subunit I [Salinicola sp. LHM]|uniref:cytochrome ubiquinol oxidase subunit I n=1 Tax=Salinicola TaxID=404432 RepID=UPI000DA13670|nr:MULTISPECIES: cytochrome ubiquinol oxidase subunit I [Salinicola]WQH34374.1 cytochrome ubiquinol oxidase subunit I [Salinicola sp. LHM]
MFPLDTLDLARLQFASTLLFHIIFLALSIGLSTYLAFLRCMAAWKGDAIYMALYRYWLPHFTANYGAGVVSGVVMAFELGLNWQGFTRAAGGINGVLLSYEVVTAFFLEATFFGLMIFGEGKIGTRMHCFSAIMVAVGAYLSSFWILASNSWMQTPAGFLHEAGTYVPVDWLAVVFNPSSLYRLVHMSLAAMIATAFVVASIAAWHLLKDRTDPVSRKMLSMALWMLTFVVPLQIAAGDLHGLNTLENQPVKVAAMEAYWEHKPEQGGMPMVVAAWPDSASESNRFALEIPRLSSLYLTHSLTEKIQPLTAWPETERPNVPLVFWSFRLMVYTGFAMLGIVAVSLYLRHRRSLFDTRWFLRAMTLTLPMGLIAIEAGWITTEAGRQPWIIYGEMTTREAVTPYGTWQLIASLAVLWTIYTLVSVAGTYLFFKLTRRSPRAMLAKDDNGVS